MTTTTNQFHQHVVFKIVFVVTIILFNLSCGENMSPHCFGKVMIVIDLYYKLTQLNMAHIVIFLFYFSNRSNKYIFFFLLKNKNNRVKD